jgi:hypothetical protein
MGNESEIQGCRKLKLFFPFDKVVAIIFYNLVDMLFCVMRRPMENMWPE